MGDDVGEDIAGISLADLSPLIGRRHVPDQSEGPVEHSSGSLYRSDPLDLDPRSGPVARSSGSWTGPDPRSIQCLLCVCLNFDVNGER